AGNPGGGDAGTPTDGTPGRGQVESNEQGLKPLDRWKRRPNALLELGNCFACCATCATGSPGQEFARGKALAPAYTAAESSSSSMRRSWLYLFTRSPRAGAPVLIWPAFTATDRSAIVVSSVSPLRWETIAVKPARWARLIASRVSLRVPIWLTFTSRELSDFSSIPRARRSGLVTNRSSPTICTLSPIWETRSLQLPHSSSLSGSS